LKLAEQVGTSILKHVLFTFDFYAKPDDDPFWDKKM
jgi:hypothetical protein